jgi:Tfp pilus assembly protein PilP
MPASPIASPPAQPSLAETIEISGILETTNHISVLVQVPNEATSRYVNVGDYIANGRVLVKRVEMGLEPIVVLEQDGREVIRSIGTI